MLTLPCVFFCMWMGALLPHAPDEPEAGAHEVSASAEVQSMEPAWRIPGSFCCHSWNLSRLKGGREVSARAENQVKKPVESFLKKWQMRVFSPYVWDNRRFGKENSQLHFLVWDRWKPDSGGGFEPRVYLMRNVLYAPKSCLVRFCGAAGGRLIVRANRTIALDTGWNNRGLKKGRQMKIRTDKPCVLEVLLAESDPEASGGILLVEYAGADTPCAALHLFRTDFAEPDEALLQYWRNATGADIAPAADAPVWLLPQMR